MERFKAKIARYKIALNNDIFLLFGNIFHLLDSLNNTPHRKSIKIYVDDVPTVENIPAEEGWTARIASYELARDEP